MTSPRPVPVAAELRRLREELRPLPARRRLDALLSRPDAAAWVARWPAADLFALVQEVGLADSLELVDACPVRTLQAFLDLGAWQRDRVDLRALATLYTGLIAANPERAAARLLRLDQDLCTLFLKLHSRVTDLSTEPEPDDEAPESLRSPDGRFVIEFVDPPGSSGETAADALGLGEAGRSLARRAAAQVVLGLFQKGPRTTERVLNAVRWHLPSQLEESAFQGRSARLGDLGFPTREEAMRLLAWRDPDAPLAAPVPSAPVEPAADLALSLYVDPDDAPKERFLAAAAAVSPARREGVQRELAAVVNRLCVARGVSPGLPQALTATVREARQLCDLGLAYRARGDVSLAAPLLESTAVTEFFRVGNSVVLRLAQQAREAVAPDRELVNYLDAPGGPAVVALLGKPPRFLAGVTEKGALETRPFALLEEVAAAGRVVAETGFKVALAVRGLGLTAARLKTLDLRGTNLGTPEELSVEILLTTALARVAAGGMLDCSPLDAPGLEGARRALQDVAALQRAGAALSTLVPAEAAFPLSTVLLSRLREELEGIPAGDRVDPRFVTRVLTRVES